MTRFPSWLSSLARVLWSGSTVSRGWGSPPTPPVRRGFRPSVEALEGREVPAVFTVTNTLDAGAGSLRQAIVRANAHPNAGVRDQIRFDIGPSTQIALQSSLPDITEAVLIDGTTQPGSGNGPGVQLDGLGIAVNGLVLRDHSGSTVKGLVIGRCLDNGILLSGGGGHTVARNFIGTNANGTFALANGNDGVHVEASRDNTIRRNLLSGNGDDGVEVNSGSGNRIEGNRIGTSVSGLFALGNGFGVNLDESRRTLVLDNVIAASRQGSAVSINGGSGHLLQGNLIGLALDGVTFLGNGNNGINILSSRNNRIGGPAPAQRNVIAGNAGQGVSIDGGDSTGNRVQGNFIGTDRSGTLDRGNGGQGVVINGGATRNAVVGNVISGNGGDGVKISELSTTGNVLRGNKIGTDVSGKKDLGNDENGVLIAGGTSGNVIGGAKAGQGNVIAGNGDAGVAIESSEGNRIERNFIGVDATGLKALDNETDGVAFVGASDNRVLGNVISSLEADGVFIGGLIDSNDNQIRRNLIGVGVDGKRALGSRGGISINGGAGNLIRGNVIAHHTDTGVSISSAEDFGNTISRNRIFGNGDLGIDVGAFGPTANDPLDGDLGPNRQQNFPEIKKAAVAAGQTVIAGTIGSTPGTRFRIEFFASPNAVLSGLGAGARFLGSVVVRTDAGGNASFRFVAARALAAGSAVTATATSLATGDTSEFSAARAVKT